MTQIELLGEPPAARPDDLTPWPRWPLKLRLSYAMRRQGGRRGEQDFAISTTKLTGNGARAELHWAQEQPAPPFEPIEGTDERARAELVLLAMGFLHPEQRRCSTRSASRRTRAATPGPAPTRRRAEGVFAAGDARRGQSLIVWAINEGRQCARMVDRYLEGLDREPVVVGGGDADEGPEGPPQVAGPS